jgi:TonB-dependent starch-binding outer membrane protein SusC
MKLKLLLLKLMKFSCFGLMLQAVFISLLMAYDGNAQKKQLSVKEVMIRVNLRDATLPYVFSAIEKQTVFVFNYDDHIVHSNSAKINIMGQKSVADVLLLVSEIANVKFKQVNNNINVENLKNENDKSNKLEIVIQTKRITGKVTSNEDNEGLPGVNVIEKGTANGTITDMQGRYSLEVTEGATLVFSSVGFVSEEVVIDNRSVIDIVMMFNIQQLEELVVVGYGSQSQRSVTGSISSVQGDKIMRANTASIDNLLQGKAAGVVINQNSAQPGSSMDIVIRGNISPRGGSRPLYVIDGVPIQSEGGINPSKIGSGNNFVDGTSRSPLTTINPSDIETIDILKDASATAIYGSAAANGVILITTKKGKQGDLRVNYNSSYSVQNIREDWERLDAWEYLELSNKAAKENWLFTNRYVPYGTTAAPNTGWPINYSDEYIAGITESYNHTDAITRMGKIFDQNLSFSGGSNKMRYFTSFNYFDQKALLKTTDFKRFSGRVNLDFDLNSWLKLDIRSTYSHIDASNPTSGGGRWNANEARQTNAAFYFNPQLPLMQADGSLTLADHPLIPNPLAWLYMKDETRTQRVMFAPNLTVKVSNDLNLNLTAGIDRTSSERDGFSPTKARMPEQSTRNFGGFSNNFNNNNSLESYLSYNKEIGANHALSVVAGAGYYQSHGHNYNMTMYNIITDALENNNLALAPTKDLHQFNSFRWERTKISQFARLNYTFMNKYILGLTTRRDGSSQFPDNHKYGIFPGVSGAWIISDENFLKSNNFLSFLKIRAGWGTSGNESAINDNYYYLDQFATGYGYQYYFGGQLNQGLLQSVQSNPNLVWETNVTKNIGIDYKLFNNRISGSLEVYRRTAKDLLDISPLPSDAAVTQIHKNVGSTQSDGIEFDIRAEIIRKKDFAWNTSFVVSHNKAYWLERNPGVNIAPWIGEKDEIRAIYGWQTNGLFKSLEEVNSYTSNGVVLQPLSLPGTIKYIDQNSDGKLDGEDVIKLGSRDPKINFGIEMNFEFKRFDLSLNTYGATGMTTSDGYTDISQLVRIKEKENQSTYIRNAWSTFNPEGTRPGFWSPTDSNNPAGNTNFFLQKTNYVRIKNLTLGYTISDSWLKQNRIAQGARLYVDLQNPFVFTNYVGLDPEMERNNAPFPIPVTYAFGINVNF